MRESERDHAGGILPCAPAVQQAPRRSASIGNHVWQADGPKPTAHQRDGWHAVDHLSLLGAATWFWAAVRKHRVMRHHGVVLAMIAALSFGGTALGALLVFGRSGAYPAPADGMGLSSASDQQLAGLLMSVLPGIGLLALMARVVLEALALPVTGETTRAPPARPTTEAAT